MGWPDFRTLAQAAGDLHTLENYRGGSTRTMANSTWGRTNIE